MIQQHVAANGKFYLEATPRDTLSTNTESSTKSLPLKDKALSQNHGALPPKDKAKNQAPPPNEEALLDHAYNFWHKSPTILSSSIAKV